ncbi:hypothetical protein LO80_04530 [Candidatus Francisella endociliophora]|uniref:PQ loop repeat family protein n=1 Tax=Candidatus Francisella endociliophora TaxID=653937 RepID=A0A097ERT7_9GAMM|nr:hypothetical protein LO80_04530 [Francisella sp. FSC1006]
MSKEFLGQIVLNASFLIYCIQFVPQIIHNFRNKQNLSNISLLTQFGIFITLLCDIVETIGFGYDWQYAAVAMIYLIGVCTQQLQISFYHKKMPEVINLSFIALFALAMLAMGSNNTKLYNIISHIGFATNILYWFPQIYKNYKQKRADGFSLIFILIAFIGTILYLLSAILLSWDLVFILNAIIMFPIISLLLLQKFQYKEIKF